MINPRTPKKLWFVVRSDNPLPYGKKRTKTFTQAKHAASEAMILDKQDLLDGVYFAYVDKPSRDEDLQVLLHEAGYHRLADVQRIH